MTTRRIRTAITALVALLLLAAPAGAALAQGSDLTISPTRIEQDIHADEVTSAVRVANGGTTTTAVHVRVTGLGHDLHGTPRLLEDDEVIERFEVAPADLLLEPGEAREVQVRATSPGPGLYAAVVVEPDRGLDDDAVMAVRTQLATLVLLRGPAEVEDRIGIEEVRLDPGPGGTEPPYQVAVVAANEGEAHVRPTGEVAIHGPDGEHLETVELQGEAIIPGYARQLTSRPWTPPDGLTGEVELRVRLDDPSATATGTAELEDGRLVVDTDAEAAPDAGDTDATGGAFIGDDADAARTGPLVVAGLLLVLAVLALLLAWRRSRSDDDEAPVEQPEHEESERAVPTA